MSAICRPSVRQLPEASVYLYLARNDHKKLHLNLLIQVERFTLYVKVATSHISDIYNKSSKDSTFFKEETKNERRFLRFIR